MGWVFAIVMTLLFMGTVLLVSAVMAMEERMMSDPEELREICGKLLNIRGVQAVKRTNG